MSNNNNNCGKGITNVVNGVTTELLKVPLNAITTTITKTKKNTHDAGTQLCKQSKDTRKVEATCMARCDANRYTSCYRYRYKCCYRYRYRYIRM